MSHLQETAELPEMLHWNPRRFVDPPPPDILFKYLDKFATVELARVNVELSLNVLKAQTEALKKVQDVLARVK